MRGCLRNVHTNKIVSIYDTFNLAIDIWKSIPVEHRYNFEPIQYRS